MCSIFSFKVPERKPPPSLSPGPCSVLQPLNGQTGWSLVWRRLCRYLLGVSFSCVPMSYGQIIFQSFLTSHLYPRSIFSNVHLFLWGFFSLTKFSAQAEASRQNFTSKSVFMFLWFHCCSKNKCLFFSHSSNYAQLTQKITTFRRDKKAETPFDARTEEKQLPACAVVCYFPRHCPVLRPELKQ